MGRLRTVTGWVAVLGVMSLVGLGWWTMLASERDAVHASQVGARQAAAGAAIAIELATQNGLSAADAATLSEQAGAARVVVRNPSGEVLAGTVVPGRPTVRVALRNGGSVEAQVPVTRDQLGVGRYSNAILATSLVVLVASLAALANVVRDRRRDREELARLSRKFDEVAVVDELTGFGNRARLVGDLGIQVARGHRYGSQVGLAVFAVDGLDTSDALMAQVGTLLAGQARAADACFRLAPNRIAVVLADQDEVGAAIAAERIRAAVVLSGLCTVSVGVTALGKGEPVEVDELVARAESAASEAAAGGGNRVVDALVLRRVEA